MQLTLPILLSLLSSTALALPTTTNTPNTTTTLEKRKEGWVGGFSNAQCAGPVAPGYMPFVNENGQCYRWAPASGTSYIGVNYGSGLVRRYEVTFYTDSHCKNVNGVNNYVKPGDKGMACTNANLDTNSFMIDVY